MTFTRITVDRQQMGGVPCLRALHVPLATVVAMVADGYDRSGDSTDLQREAMIEMLQYAAEAVREQELDVSIRPEACPLSSRVG
jgi:uncharacterized protein (DUF433 family)